MKPASWSKPFHLVADKGSVLLLHGLTGTPYEVWPIADTLHQAGFGCYAPILRGHGTCVEDLFKIRAEHWVQDAIDGLNAISTPSVIVGSSMGGLLGCLLAARFPEKVRGLVLLSPAFSFQPLGCLMTTLARWGMYHLLPVIPKYGGIDAQDPAVRTESPSYRHVALRSLLELHVLQKEAKSVLHGIQCPTLVCYGLKDRTVEFKRSLKDTSRIASKKLKHILYARSGHVMGADVEKEDVQQDVLDFCLGLGLHFV